MTVFSEVYIIILAFVIIPVSFLPILKQMSMVNKVPEAHMHHIKLHWDLVMCSRTCTSMFWLYTWLNTCWLTIHSSLSLLLLPNFLFNLLGNIHIGKFNLPLSRAGPGELLSLVRAVQIPPHPCHLLRNRKASIFLSDNLRQKGGGGAQWVLMIRPM